MRKHHGQPQAVFLDVSGRVSRQDFFFFPHYPVMLEVLSSGAQETT